MKLQIISYTFPPTPGVGGRRWAKFAKYLNREGFDIRVIAAKGQDSERSAWCRDIKEIEDKVTYLESNYPRHLGFYDTSVIHKVLYRLGKWKSILATKGNYYDKSIHWLEALKSEVRKNYAEGYKTVAVSVAPFHSALALSELKTELADMKLIVDFRDPWTTNRTAYGFDGLSKSRQKFEIEAEKKVINSADHVVSVAKEMNEHFQNLCTTDTKFTVIPNGFDPEDIPAIDYPSTSTTGRFVFTGTLYDKSLHQFKVLVNAIDMLKKQSPKKYKSLRLDFFGSVPNEALIDFENHEILNFHGKIPLERVYQEISNSSGCMLFLTDDLNYSFSTKFYEYLALKKPILLFAKPGITKDLLEENELGVSITNKNAETLLKSLSEKKLPFDQSKVQRIIDGASVRALSRKWCSLLNLED